MGGGSGALRRQLRRWSTARAYPLEKLFPKDLRPLTLTAPLDPPTFPSAHSKSPLLADLKAALRAQDLLSAGRSYRQLEGLPPADVYEELLATVGRLGLVGDAAELLTDFKASMGPQRAAAHPRLPALVLNAFLEADHWPRVVWWLETVLPDASADVREEVLASTLVACEARAHWGRAAQVVQVAVRHGALDPLTPGHGPPDLRLVLTHPRAKDWSPERLANLEDRIVEQCPTPSLDGDLAALPPTPVAFIPLTDPRRPPPPA